MDDCGQAAWQVERAADDGMPPLVDRNMPSHVLVAQAPQQRPTHFAARYITVSMGGHMTAKKFGIHLRVLIGSVSRRRDFFSFFTL
jgi:hypothetical protein